MSVLAVFFTPILAAVVGGASAGIVPFNGPAPTSVADADRAVATQAQATLEAIAAGTLDTTTLAPAFRAEFTPEVAAADRGFLKGRGEPKRFLFLQANDAGDSVRYVFVASWGDGNTLSYTFGLEKRSGLIDALYFRPYASQGL